MRHLPQYDVRSRLPRTVSVAASMILLLGLAACGSDDEPDSKSNASDTSTVVGESDQATTETTETTESTDSTESTGGTVPSATLDSMLLTGEKMPGVNQETLWTEDGTGPEDAEGVSDCQKTDLLTIGAEDAIAREFEDEGQNASAGQVVARFADDKSAWRAHQVVQSWLKTCAERLDDDVRKVSKPRAVAIPGGKAHVVLAQHGNRNADEHEFDGIGVVRKGSMLSVIQIDVESQDYNYEPGQEPATRAVKAAAGKLG